MSSSYIGKQSRNTLKICWRLADKTRTSFSLGRCTMKVAREFQVRFDKLLEYRSLGATLPAETIEWANRLNDGIRKNLLHHRLLPATHGSSLGDWLDNYSESRKSVSNSTRVKWDNTIKRMKTFFGEDMKLHAITPGDAFRFREQLKTTGNQGGTPLADASVNRHCGIASQFFNAALKSRLTTENPFADIDKTNLVNRNRQQYVSAETVDKVIAEISTWQMRLYVALARYGGLRCPSEPAALRWVDVHFGDGTDADPGFIMVSNVKTRHHPTVDDYRKIPLFQELLPYLQEAWEQSKEGAVFVIEGVKALDHRRRNSDAKVNLTSAVESAQKRAGVTPWPKQMQNLRSTRQTELEDNYPTHVVNYWMNNSVRVAQKHYLQITDDHHLAGCGIAPESKAVSPAVTAASFMPIHAPSAKTQTLENKAFPVTDHHDPSQEMPKWAMRDSTGSRITL